jgi:type II secretory ATPase GspE/PulE/Tfp pilus assembly ATPase PilB-like protein
VFYRGRGCEQCLKKGYSGRAVLIEAMRLTPEVKGLILKGAQEYQLKAVARKAGMKSLREDGIAKVLKGITSPEEVMRVTVKDQELEK